MTPAQLAALTLGDVDARYRAGTISQTEYEAYRRAWADAGGHVLGYVHAHGWTTPGPEAVEDLAAEIVHAARTGRNRLPFERLAA